MPWGALGSHRFERTAGPQAETLKMAANYAEHARIGRSPTQQITGHKLQDYELQVKLHHSIGDVSETLRDFKKSMDEGEVLDLALGEEPDTGIWAGQWLLASMDLESITRMPGGRVYSADLKLRLREWVQREGLETSPRKPPAVKPKKTPAPAKPLPKSGY